MGQSTRRAATYHFLGHDATDANFELKIDTSGMEALGNAKFAGIPATIRWISHFAPPAGDYRDRITLSAVTSAEALSTLGFDYRKILSGPMEIDVV